MRILLADDDTKIHVILRMWLEKKGHGVDSVNNGRDALTALRNTPFDILITGVNMPVLNGIDLVKETLRLESGPELIILLTSRCDNEQLKNHFASPKVHLHNKPFSPVALTELIETLSENNQQDTQMAGVTSSGYVV
jgi:DNA-binding response OmpR family regulator